MSKSIRNYLIPLLVILSPSAFALDIDSHKACVELRSLEACSDIVKYHAQDSDYPRNLYYEAKEMYAVLQKEKGQADYDASFQGRLNQAYEKSRDYLLRFDSSLRGSEEQKNEKVLAMLKRFLSELNRVGASEDEIIDLFEIAGQCWNKPTWGDNQPLHEATFYESWMDSFYTYYKTKPLMCAEDRHERRRADQAARDQAAQSSQVGARYETGTRSSSGSGLDINNHKACVEQRSLEACSDIVKYHAQDSDYPRNLYYEAKEMYAVLQKEKGQADYDASFQGRLNQAYEKSRDYLLRFDSSLRGSEEQKNEKVLAMLKRFLSELNRVGASEDEIIDLFEIAGQCWNKPTWGDNQPLNEATNYESWMDSFYTYYKTKPLVCPQDRYQQALADQATRDQEAQRAEAQAQAQLEADKRAKEAAAIAAEEARRNSLTPLERVKEDVFTNWSEASVRLDNVEMTLRGVGATDEDLIKIYQTAKTCWSEHTFTAPYRNDSGTVYDDFPLGLYVAWQDPKYLSYYFSQFRAGTLLCPFNANREAMLQAAEQKKKEAEAQRIAALPPVERAIEELDLGYMKADVKTFEQGLRAQGASTDDIVKIIYSIPACQTKETYNDNGRNRTFGYLLRHQEDIPYYWADYQAGFLLCPLNPNREANLKAADQKKMSTMSPLEKVKHELLTSKYPSNDMSRQAVDHREAWKNRIATVENAFRPLGANEAQLIDLINMIPICEDRATFQFTDKYGAEGNKAKYLDFANRLVPNGPKVFWEQYLAKTLMCPDNPEREARLQAAEKAAQEQQANDAAEKAQEMLLELKSSPLGLAKLAVLEQKYPLTDLSKDAKRDHGWLFRVLEKIEQGSRKYLSQHNASEDQIIKGLTFVYKLIPACWNELTFYAPYSPDNLVRMELKEIAESGMRFSQQQHLEFFWKDALENKLTCDFSGRIFNELEKHGQKILEMASTPEEAKAWSRGIENLIGSARKKNAGDALIKEVMNLIPHCWLQGTWQANDDDTRLWSLKMALSRGGDGGNEFQWFWYRLQRGELQCSLPKAQSSEGILGEWQSGDDNFLTINSSDGAQLDFLLEAVYGTNVGQIEGQANVNGSTAQFQEGACTVSFTIQSDSIDVQAEGCGDYAGLNVGFDGHYVRP